MCTKIVGQCCTTLHHVLCTTSFAPHPCFVRQETKPNLANVLAHVIVLLVTSYAILRYLMLSYAILCCLMLACASLYYLMLSYAILCYLMLSYAIVCHMMLSLC